MGFSNPIWLWGLTGLMLPIAIHFISRKESKVIRLGSLRHLQNSVTNQSVNFRLNELLLLLLRCLLIILTVGLLSGLFLESNEATGQQWLVIEKGVNQNNFKKLIDSLKQNGFTIHRLETDFPAPGKSIVKDTAVNYWNLVESLPSTGRTVVLSRNRVEGFRGKRIAKPDNLTWVAADSDSGNFNLIIVPEKDDSVFIRRVAVNDYATAFRTEIEKDQSIRDSVAEGVLNPTDVLIVSDEEHVHDRKIMEAAIRAIEKNSIFPLNHKSVTVEEYNDREAPDWTLWMTNKTFPSNLSGNSIRLSARENPGDPLLVQRTDCIGGKECWTITSTLSVESALGEHLVSRLSSILLRTPKAMVRSIVTSNDRRTLPETMLWSAVSKPKSMEVINKYKDSDIGPPLAFLLLLLLAAERFLAIKRNQ